MKKIISIVCCFFLGISSITAQDLLPLEEAIQMALESNYSIKLQKLDLEKNQNNISRAVAGQRPTVALSANYEYGYEDATNQTAPLGEGDSAPIALDGTRNLFTLQNRVSVPIFTGFRGKYTYIQLENNARLSQAQLNAVVEQVVSLVVQQYLEVARLQRSLEIDKEVIENSLDRLDRVTAQEEFGAGNALQKLQAEVDLKTDSANYRTNALSYQNAKRNLNKTLVKPSTYDFTVETDVQLIGELDYDELKADLLRNNTDLQLGNLNIDRSSFQQEIVKSSQYPTLSFYAQGQYSNINNNAGFLQSTETLGPSAGVQFSWTLFDAGKRRIERQNAQIDVQRSQTQQLDLQQQLEINLSNAFASYQDLKNQLSVEQYGLQTFQDNYAKIKDNYDLGLVNATDLRQAQINLYAAQNRVNNLEGQLKRQEIELLRISGRLKQNY